MAAFLDGRNGLAARLAGQLLARCRELTTIVRDLEAEVTTLINRLVPALLSPSSRTLQGLAPSEARTMTERLNP
ncbi:hypothetical protein [Streptomyces olivochromogenes]|uniref:hypothetical protein n=1 Tax=Streptomyces olivochromogenes TaxID=1963 RepID=UPI00131DC9A1|nr:hypothetical protein [Streptomyces olivochromogenes]